MEGTTLERIQHELANQDGSNDAPEPTDAEWAKIQTQGDVGYGSLVLIRFSYEAGGYDGIEDWGYLTCLPGASEDWEESGIVHIPRPWVEKERSTPEWHTLYSLCRNPMVAELIITVPELIITR